MSIWLGILIAVLLADLITGIVHWWEDIYGDPNWKIIGKLIIEPNIKHHEDPLLFTSSSFWSRNYQTLTPACIVILLNWWFVGPWWLTLAVFIAGFGNEIHAWSHKARGDNHWIINLLHDMCLIQTPKHHGKHHHSPFSTHFCAITNILNPILELTKFWRVIEFCLSCVGINKNTERTLA